MLVFGGYEEEERPHQPPVEPSRIRYGYDQQPPPPQPPQKLRPPADGGPSIKVLLEDGQEEPVYRPQKKAIRPRQQVYREPEMQPSYYYEDESYYPAPPPPREEHLFVDQSPTVQLEVFCPSDDYEEIW